MVKDDSHSIISEQIHVNSNRREKSVEEEKEDEGGCN